MSIASQLEAAANVGPYPVNEVGGVYYVGAWPLAADGSRLGPFEIDTANSQFVGPYPWTTLGGQTYMGPWAVK